MKCFDCGLQATHYVNIIFELDERWADEGTVYSDDYTCAVHLASFIASHHEEGSSIIEVKAERLSQ